MGGEAVPDVRPAALRGDEDRDTEGSPITGDDERNRQTSAEVFPQSVASGGPTPTGVVLWTRLAPAQYDPEQSVHLVVARDEECEERIVSGFLPTERIGDEHDHTIRIDLDGALDPDSTYYYSFSHDGVRSRTGRCRTLPAPDASPESIRFCVLACQDYENGYFGALALVAREEVDFLVHLGDFIYESAAGLFRGRGSPALPDRDPTLPSGQDQASTLADFRVLHRLYRSDPLLQRALEAHTLVAGWDDHGISNDRYWSDESNSPVLPDHPRGNDPAFATRLTKAGIRAWYEYLPSRVRYDPDAEGIHDSFRLYRSLSFGNLLELLVTDHRLYRDGPPSRALSVAGVTFGFGGEGDPDRSMLGAEQADWFERRVWSTETRWLGWASAVLSVPLGVGVGPFTLHPKAGSTWDGFPAERRRVFEALADADPAVVTLSGDLHNSVVGTQRLAGEGTTTPIGTEFATPAVTSVNFAEALGVDSGFGGRLTRPLFRRGFPAMNSHMDFFDSHEWGYSVVEFTRETCTYTAYAVDKTTDATDADRRVLARYRRPIEEPIVERESSR